MSTLQGGGRRGYRVDAEGAAGGQIVPVEPFPIQNTTVSAGDVVEAGPTGKGYGEQGDPMFTLDTKPTHYVGFPLPDDVTPDVSPTLVARNAKGSPTSSGDGFALVGVGADDVAPTVTSKWSKGSGGPAGDEAQNLVGFDLAQITSAENRSNPKPGDPNPTLAATGQAHVAFLGNVEQAGTLTKSLGGGGADENRAAVGHIVLGADLHNAATTGDQSRTLRAGNGSATSGAAVVSATGDTAHTLTAEGSDASEDGTGRGTPIITHTLTAGDGSATEDGRGRGTPLVPAVAATLKEGERYPSHEATQVPSVDLTAVRRLTPVECERLQGFPDGWTAYACQVKADGNRWQVVQRDVPQNDAPRYRQLGNSIATVVFSWVAGRLVKHA